MRAIALNVFSRIPAPFCDYLDGIRVQVEDFADADTLAAVGLDNPWHLSGLYHGQPLDKQSVWSSGQMPPVITLFRSPLLAEMQQRDLRLEDLIAHVVIHEVGHHFGLSDDDMHALEAQAGDGDD
ncbi:neutral zinc metallopeptidase [Altererythrobacter endophyticus]|uniref:Neutral zinc metallopeptidase n=2 Tax=Altericroceibacterium endophyticum TaxID=1808508 RepID=A0A6I4T7X2_9SPHN|nr:neutral zinc metallopeptidase [Altericroceibacterium endophyticum]